MYPIKIIFNVLLFLACYNILVCFITDLLMLYSRESYKNYKRYELFSIVWIVVNTIICLLIN